MPTFKNHPCPICGTVKYKSTSETHYVCKNGHQMAGYVRQEGDLDTFFGVRRVVRKSALTEVKQYIRGAELDDALNRLFQYGLQVLSRSFIVDLGFPDEFEYILRELWLLYITNKDVQLVNAHNTTVKQPKSNDQANMDDDVNDILYESDTDSDDSDDSDGNENGNEYDNNGDDKINDNSNSNNNKIDRDIDVDELKVLSPWPRLRFKHLLVFCYLACLYLGWPVTVSDIHRWCATFRLPYLSILESMPADMVKLLKITRLLPMLSLPSVGMLRSQTKKFGNAFKRQCGLVFPKVNTSLIIYRYCTQMILPVEMYFCARTMLDQFPFSKRYKRMDGSFTNGSEDLYIMIIVLTLVKMCYGLDDQQYNLKYENPDIPPPLPKHIWLKHIQANIKRWDNLYTKKYINSSDLDLSILVDYLQNSVGNTRTMKNKKNWSKLLYICTYSNG
ncbi:unnamed protein product [Cunninghamella blakesleeana]